MDAISNVLSVMSLVGLWTPQGWDSSWKGVVYKMYAKILDALLLTYFILKTTHTYFSINRNHLDILLESLFESLYIMILSLQRFIIRWEESNLRGIIQELSSLPCGHPLFRAYERHSRRVSIILALGGVAAAIIYLVNFLIGTNTDTTWRYGPWKKTNPQRRLFVEIWLPFDETVSPYYEIVQPIDFFCMTVTCTSLYIFSSLIPLILVRICCHFRVIATELEKNLEFEQRNSIIQCRNRDTEKKRDLKSLIQYHQSVLRSSCCLCLSRVQFYLETSLNDEHFVSLDYTIEGRPIVSVCLVQFYLETSLNDEYIVSLDYTIEGRPIVSTSLNDEHFVSLDYTIEGRPIVSTSLNDEYIVSLDYTIEGRPIVSACLGEAYNRVHSQKSSFGKFHFLRYLLLMSIPLMELFLFCWYGEQLRTHGLLVHKAVYFCPWYLMVPNLQKCLIIVSTRALKPVQLEIMPHFIPVSLETFIGVTRLSYSAYTLLLTVTSSNKYRTT
ncbi:Or13ap [Homalodisca vitripennis]|nr:Or13ap [Homalodisca vitripennis]